MKPKFRRQISKTTDLVDHVQALTDDLATVINRGLSFSENLPSAITLRSVTSARPFTIQTNKTLEGAYPIFVDNSATWNSIRYRRIKENQMEITMVFDDNGTHDVKLFIIGN